MTFGQRLREERKRLGLTQRSAASLCGISRESWGMYERGVARPSFVAFELTGLDVAYVLTGQRFSAETLAALYIARSALIEIDNHALRAAALASLDALMRQADRDGLRYIDGASCSAEPQLIPDSVPSLDLYQKVRAAFIVQGTTLKAWCRENGLQIANVRHALTGSWNGPGASDVRTKAIKDAQLGKLKELLS